MQIRVNSSQFADNVTWVAKTIPTRPSSVALGGILIETVKGRLLLTGSDGETITKRRVDVTEIVTEGKVLVPKQFADIVRALPDGDLTLTLEDSRVKIECGTARFGVPTLPVEDYPTYTDLPGATGKLPSGDFARAVTQVAVAASKDTTLPVLTAVLLSAEGGRLTLVATDKYRMAMTTMPWNPTDVNSTDTVLVPRAALVDAAKSFADGGDITLALTAADGDTVSKVGFGISGASLSTLQIAGDFPKFRGLMPTDFSSAAEVPSDKLTEVVRRVGLVLRQSVPIKLTFGDNKILVEGGDQSGDDADGHEQVECDYDGEPVTIAFNPTYLLDGIGACGTEKVKISLQSSTKPAVISTGDEDGGFRYLIMPVRLTS